MTKADHIITFMIGTTFDTNDEGKSWRKVFVLMGEIPRKSIYIDEDKIRWAR
jgi:hypothetical protein